MKRLKFVLTPLVAALAAGCAGAGASSSAPEPDSRVVIDVRNSSEVPLRVQLCTEETCMGHRVVQARQNTVYRFHPGGTGRATVTASTAPINRQTRAGVSMSNTRAQRVRPANRILDQQLVDFKPGDHREVVFSTF